MVVFDVCGFIFFHYEFLKVEMLLILWQKLGRWQKKELSLSPASKTTLLLKLGYYFRLLLFFISFLYLFIYCAYRHTCGGQSTACRSWFSFHNVCLGIKFMSSCLPASTFTHRAV